MKYLCLVYGDETAFHDLPGHPAARVGSVEVRPVRDLAVDAA